MYKIKSARALYTVCLPCCAPVAYQPARSTRHSWPTSLLRPINSSNSNNRKRTNTGNNEGISVQQLLASVRGQQAESNPQSAGNPWIFTGAAQNAKAPKLTLQYAKGQLLPDSISMAEARKHLRSRKWQLQSIVVGRSGGAGTLEGVVLAHKRAAQLKAALGGVASDKLVYLPSVGADVAILHFGDKQGARAGEL